MPKEAFSNENVLVRTRPKRCTCKWRPWYSWETAHTPVWVPLPHNEDCLPGLKRVKI